MYVKASDNSNVVVFLNGKPLLTFVEASEEEGWVTIPDIKQMAPLKIQSDIVDEITLTEWEEIPTKKINGKVVIKTINKDNV